MQLLFDCGLEHIQLGLQTASERINYDIYERKVSNKQFLKSLQMINSLKPKLEITIDIIFDNPFESDSDIIQTIYFLSELNKTKIPYKITPFSLSFYPETKISQRAIKENIIDEKDIAMSYTKNYRKLENNFLNNLCLGVSVYNLTPRITKFFLKNKRFYSPLYLIQGKIHFMKKALRFLFRAIRVSKKYKISFSNLLIFKIRS